MANTIANAARNLDLAVWDLDDLINAYEYRAVTNAYTPDQVEEALESGALDIQGVYDEATTSIESGVEHTVIDRTIVTDPITNHQSVEVNVKYEVPVNNVVSWDVNLTVDFLTGETTNNIGGTITLQQDGETYDSVEFGDSSAGDGNNGHGNNGGGNDPSNPGNGNGNGNRAMSFQFDASSFETMAAEAEALPVEVDVVEMVAPQQNDI